MFYLKKCLNQLTFLINIFIFSLIEIKINSFECPENTPILKDNICVLLNCSKSQFENKDCIINNTKIKTQWLTNIIIFGDENARFINFATFSNGDFIVESTPCQIINAKRFFFGLKKNGRDLFKTNNKETQFYSLIPSYEGDMNKYNGEIQIVKMNQGEKKEYVLSLTKSNSYAELYDFEKDQMYKNKMINLFGVENQNTRQISLTILSNGIFYSIYGFIYDSKIYFFKFSLNTKNEIETLMNLQPKNHDLAKGNSISCFETSKSKIVCFYYNSNEGEKPAILILNHNLDKKGKTLINFRGYYDDSSFIKCIHFHDEIGVFSFYDKINDNNNNIYPFVYFIEIKDDYSLSNPLNSLCEHIILNYAIFKRKSIMNDITKISDTKVCFTATLEDHETLYIIVFHVINMEKVKIRYYSFPIFKLKNYKFLADMKSYSYNQFVMIGASVCNQSKCNNDQEDYHYSGLIMFSYANSTDEYFDISDVLLNDNEKKIENLEIDLKNYVKIENNIFGYVYSGIQISNFICTYDYIKLYSTKNFSNINNVYILEIDEKIKLQFIEDNYLKDNCSFEYNYIIIEPDRDIYDNYTNYLEISYGDDNEDEFNSMKTPLIGRTSYFNISLKNNLVRTCDDSNCDLCIESSSDICITCKSNSYFDITDGAKIKKCNQSHFEIDTTIIEEKDKNIDTSSNYYNYTTKLSILETEEEIKNEKSSIKIENCSIEEIIDNLCPNAILDQNKSEQIYKKLKEDYLNKEVANGNKIVITYNMIYQISTLKIQKNSSNTDISSIDLEICEDKLREKYKMNKEDEFIIYKKDIKNGLTTYVEYEIYNSQNLDHLDLDICNDTQISINVPVNLNEKTELLYDKMSKLGYNLFDANDSFYNDICTTYQSESGTDMLLSDRKKDIYKNNGNKTLCQAGCELQSYNLDNKKAKCSCSVQKSKNIDAKNIETSDKFYQKDIAAHFFDTLKNSNFRVVKCYKLVFSTENFFKNIGRIIMTIILLIIIILIIIYIIFEKNKINKIINIILVIYRNKIEEKKKTSIKSNNKSRNSSKRSKSFPPKNIKNGPKEKKEQKEKDKKANTPKSKSDKKKDIKENKKELRKKLINFSLKKRNKKKEKIGVESSCRKLNAKKEININNININRNPLAKGTNKSDKTNDLQLISIYKSKEKATNVKIIYTNRELNFLDYKEALKYDKRKYCQYYLSLIMQKQLILFTFCPDNSNLMSLKIISFFLSFSLYFSVNGIFFSDKTMHKIYEDKGKNDLLFQIPQIIYSLIISSFINIILKHLSLTDKNILSLKQEINYEIALKKSKSLKNSLFIKFIIFFVLSILLSICFWYYISCFCAVFSNTQIILIKDTIISFVLSMLYPFGLNLIPGLLRIPALKSKDRKCLYFISLLIAFI